MEGLRSRTELHEPVRLRAREHLVGRQSEILDNVLLQEFVHEREDLQHKHILSHIVSVLVDELYYLVLLRLQIKRVEGEFHWGHRAFENVSLLWTLPLDLKVRVQTVIVLNSRHK